MTDSTEQADAGPQSPLIPVEGTSIPVAKYNTKAVLGLILSVISVLLVLVPVVNWLLAVPGIILGVLGRSEVRVSGERSREVALAAIVIGALSAALSLMIIIGLGIAASQVAHQTTPGSDTDVCTSKTGDFTQKQLQACFDSQNN